MPTASELFDSEDDYLFQRDHAMSILLAQRAAEEEFVKSFREEVLGSCLLNREDVEQWMSEQSKKEQVPKGNWLRMPVNMVLLDGQFKTEMPEPMKSEHGDWLYWDHDASRSITQIPFPRECRQIKDLLPSD